MVAGRFVVGSPQQIAEQLSRLSGTDQLVKVFVLDEAEFEKAYPKLTEQEVDDLLTEMREDAVSAGELDLTREGIYDERYG